MISSIRDKSTRDNSMIEVTQIKQDKIHKFRRTTSISKARNRKNSNYILNLEEIYENKKGYESDSSGNVNTESKNSSRN